MWRCIVFVTFIIHVFQVTRGPHIVYLMTLEHFTKHQLTLILAPCIIYQAYLYKLNVPSHIRCVHTPACIILAGDLCTFNYLTNYLLIYNIYLVIDFAGLYIFVLYVLVLYALPHYVYYAQHCTATWAMPRCWNGALEQINDNNN